MLESNSKKIRFWCEIALSVITVVLGIVFICVVADIYYSGKDSGVIYSPEIVKARLIPLIAPLVLWLIVVVACFVLSVFFPNYGKQKNILSNREKINNLKSKLPSSGNEEFIQAKKNYSLFEIIRYTLFGVASALSVASAIITIIYIANVSNFEGKEINVAILGLVKNCVPFILSSFFAFVVAIIYETVTAKIELSHMTKMFVSGKENKHIDNLVEKSVKRLRTLSLKHDAQFVWCVRGAVLVVALVFFILGILNGGAEDVWSKAINICTECIGLG